MNEENGLMGGKKYAAAGRKNGDKNMLPLKVMRAVFLRLALA
jgi:hypothetical protein